MKSKRVFTIGLTGSIGMGKTTTAAMFADHGIPVWDADAAVKRLYSEGGEGVEKIGNMRPDAVYEGAVDVNALKAWIRNDPKALKQIEQVIHPLVAADRCAFLNSVKSKIVVLDIPLLFETGQEDEMDLICVVSVSGDIQRQRVLMRPGMTESQFELILSKQMDDADKRARADFVIITENRKETKKQVDKIVTIARKKIENA